MRICVYTCTHTHTISSKVGQKYRENFHLPINCDSNSQPFFLTEARTTACGRSEKSLPSQYPQEKPFSQEVELSDRNFSGNFYLLNWLSKYFCRTDSRITGQNQINVTQTVVRYRVQRREESQPAGQRVAGETRRE